MIVLRGGSEPAMFCGHCGTANLDSSRFCEACGQPLADVMPVPTMMLPPSLPREACAPCPTDAKAIASLVVGALSVLVPPGAIVAIVLGHMSLAKIRQSRGQLQGEGLAIAGLVLGYVVLIPMLLIVVFIVLVLWGIATAPVWLSWLLRFLR